MAKGTIWCNNRNRENAKSASTKNTKFLHVNQLAMP